jgi:hypothetical protein
MANRSALVAVTFLLLIVPTRSHATIIRIDATSAANSWTIDQITITGGPANAKVVIPPNTQGVIDVNGTYRSPTNLNLNLMGNVITVGDEHFGPISVGNKLYTSHEEAAKNRVQGGGTGAVFPSPPNTFQFSSSLFDSNQFPGASTLIFTRSIQVGSGSTNQLGQVTNLTATIAFMACNDTNFYSAQFVAFSCEYPTFCIPEMGISNLQYQILDTSSTLTGFFNTQAQQMILPLPALWLDASSNIVSSSYEMVVFQFSAVSRALADVQITSDGTFGFIPGGPWLSIGLTAQQATLLWPAYATNFSLEWASNLLPPVSWQTVTNNALLTNDVFSVPVPFQGASRFFRLRVQNP